MLCQFSDTCFSENFLQVSFIHDTCQTETAEDAVIFRYISTELGDEVYTFVLNSCVNFRAKTCMHCGNINRSHRGYLLCSPCSGGDRHTHTGEATVLLLDHQAHHCLLIYAVLAQTRCARRCMIVNMANWSDKKVKKLRNICKSTKMSTVNSIVVLLSCLRATSTPSASVQRIYLSRTVD